MTAHDVLTPITYRARALGYYQRRIDRLRAYALPVIFLGDTADGYFRVTQAALSAIEKGRQKARTPGWLADCLRAHEVAARQVR